MHTKPPAATVKLEDVEDSTSEEIKVEKVEKQFARDMELRYVRSVAERHVLEEEMLLDAMIAERRNRILRKNGGDDRLDGFDERQFRIEKRALWRTCSELLGDDHLFFDWSRTADAGPSAKKYERWHKEGKLEQKLLQALEKHTVLK
jgi:hypothetical protein